MKQFSKILEWADSVAFKGEYLNHRDTDAIAFGIPFHSHGRNGIDNIFVGKPAHTHLHDHLDPNAPFAGRLWYKSKVIAFWSYPKTKAELLKLVDRLNLCLANTGAGGGVHIDKTWKIEIPYTDDDLTSTNLMDADTDYNPNALKKSMFVSVGAYNTSIIKNPAAFVDKLQSQLNRHKKETEPEPITEWADSIRYINGEQYMFDDSRIHTYPFGFDPLKYADSKWQARIGQDGLMHTQMRRSFDIDMPYGRVWADIKVLSFWKFPASKTELKLVVKALNEEFQIVADERDILGDVVIDDSWTIEIPIETGNRIRNSRFDRNAELPAYFVPLNEYDPFFAKNPDKLKVKLDRQREKHTSSIKYNMDTKNTEPVVAESPDYSSQGNEFKDKDAYTFGYNPDDGEFKIGRTYEDGVPFYHQMMFPGIDSRNYVDFAGRFWKDSLLLSFWGVMPTKNQLKEIINDIKTELGLTTSIDSFRIEMPSNQCGNQCGDDDGEVVYFKNYVHPTEKSTEPEKEPGAKVAPKRPKTDPNQLKLFSSAIKEWADSARGYYNEDDIEEMYYSKTAIPFGYLLGDGEEYYDSDEYDNRDVSQLHLGARGETHRYSGLKSGWNIMSGRIFLKNKVIGFWKYPKDLQELKEIIKVLNNELLDPANDYHTSHGIDDTWKINISGEEGNILIPIEDYTFEASEHPEEYKEKLQKQEVNEYADALFDKEGNAIEEYTDDTAIAFGYLKEKSDGKVHLGIPGAPHHYAGLKSRGSGELSGRIFTKNKVISFWKYPKDLQELKKVIGELNDELVDSEDSEYSISDPIDDTWQIDINDDSDESILIPIEDYTFEAMKHPEEYKEKLQKQGVISEYKKICDAEAKGEKLLRNIVREEIKRYLKENVI